jgi:hypothetical protein
MKKEAWETPGSVRMVWRRQKSLTPVENGSVTFVEEYGL